MIFFNKKRGSELTLNVIIIAAIALIVLVVIIFIFSGKIKLFGQGTESCVNQGGTCTTRDASSAEKCTDSSSVYIRGTDCEKPPRNLICCKQVY